MWRVPCQYDNKDTIKPDPTATSRSPIRRRRSPALRRISSIRRSDGLYGAVNDPVYRRSAHDIAEALREDSISRAGIPDNTEAFTDAQARNSPLPPAPEYTSYTLVETGPSDHEDGALPVPETWRERRLRLAAARRGSTHNFWAFAREDERALPSYTPNFAPARLGASDSSRAEPPLEWSSAAFGSNEPRVASPHSYASFPAPAPAPRPVFSRSSEHLSAENVGSELDRQSASAVAFQPLRRMRPRFVIDGPLPSSSLRENGSPASTVDGLGDRERSFSPDPEWDTMLNTIQPDNTLPSASSSFASAAASRSFSNSHPSSRSGSSNSASSSRTHLTVPSVMVEDEEAVDFCNESDASGSDTEPEDIAEITIRQHRRRARPLEDSAPSFTDMAAPARDPTRYSRNMLRRSREASRFVQNYYSFTERNVDRNGSREESSFGSGRNSREGSARGSFSGNDSAPAADAHLQDPDLEQMRAILERLARRDDIPDEFWMSAGLTRNMAQNVVRAQGVLRARVERLERSLERL